MRASIVKRIGVSVVAAVFVLFRSPLVRAVSEAEQSLLALYFTEEELRVVSATRSLQSIERVAENIEVVTAADIEFMNAHTLADVLDTVSGVVAKGAGRFGARSGVDIQGANENRSSVFLNGVPIAFIGAGQAEIGLLPVQEIERVEVVKGPASSAWGSALGGVVNVITKSPGSAPFTATAAIGYATGRSSDSRAEISGRVGRFGYYLSGTQILTDGLTTGYDRTSAHLATRLECALGERATVAFDLSYGDLEQGDGQSIPWDYTFHRGSKRLVSDLTLSTAAGAGGRLDLALWTHDYRERFNLDTISDGSDLGNGELHEWHSGAGGRYLLSRGSHDLVIGGEWSTGKEDNSDFPDIQPEFTQWALFANDTIRMGRWTLIPGLRFDRATTGGDFLSPSLGATFDFSRKALARATVARGFTAPGLEATSCTSAGAMYQANPDLAMEKVWSYQVGLESNVANFFWIKLAAFRHDVEDAIEMTWISDEWWTYANQGRQRRHGIEASLRTRPFFHWTLGGAAFFMETKNLETRTEALDVPKAIYDLTLKYDDERSFRALLRGRHIVQEFSPDYDGTFSGVILDLHLAKKLALDSHSSIEGFLGVNNILNGERYVSTDRKNPRRWVEGGIRVNF